MFQLSRWLFVHDFGGDEESDEGGDERGDGGDDIKGDLGWWPSYAFVWDAVQRLRTRLVLQRTYKSYLRGEDCNSAVLERFFRATLGIPDCTYDVYMEDLDDVRKEEDDNSAEVTGIYKALQDLLPSLGQSEKEILRYNLKS